MKYFYTLSTFYYVAKSLSGLKKMTNENRAQCKWKIEFKTYVTFYKKLSKKLLKILIFT